MTREEEISKRLLEIGTSNFGTANEYVAYMAGYMDAAKWADRTMIEKACEWLKKEYPKAAAYYEHPDSFIDQFKRAMKGE